MTGRKIAALMLPLMLATAACEEDDDLTGTGTQAQVRVVHASANAPNVDVLVNNDIVLSNVPYTQFSTYLPVPSGAQRLRVRPAGGTNAVIDVTPILAANSSYTVLAVGPVSAIEPLLLQDDRTAPTAGNVKVRVVHAAPGAGNVDVFVTDPNASLATATPVLTNVAFKVASNFLSVPAGTYRIRVTPTGNRNVVAIDVPSVTLTAGQIVTAVAAENVGGGAPYRIIVVN